MEEERSQEFQQNNPTVTPQKQPSKDHYEQEKVVDPFLVYLYRVTFKPSLTYFFNHADRGEGFSHILNELSKSAFPDKDFIESYLRHMYRRTNKIKTIHNTFLGIGYFISYLNNTFKRSIKEVTRADIESFIEHEQDRGLKLSTVRTRLMTVRAFIRFLIEQEELRQDVLTRRIMIKLPKSLPKAIDPEDINLFISIMDNVRDKALLLLLLRTGLRIGELLNVKVVDLCRSDKKILIYQAMKTDSGRVVYYSGDAAEALDKWLAKRDDRKEYLFYGQGNKRLGYSAARSVFIKHIEKAGLMHKGYTIHCLRHTYASELLNAGMPLECLQNLMGHTSAEVTRRYARLTDKTREAEYFKAMQKIERGEIDGHY